MSLQVVNLGLPKSGTTTLARALKRAGLRVADHRISAGQTTNDAHKGKSVGVMLYRGYYETGDPGADFTDFDAISEMSLVQVTRSFWPQTDYGLIEALRAHHTGLKFIASTRPAEDISASMGNWSNLGAQRLPKASVPGLPTGYGKTDADRIRWINAHYAHLRAIFAGDPSFLECDVSNPETPARIARHIGRKLPWWGQANKSKRAVS